MDFALQVQRAGSILLFEILDFAQQCQRQHLQCIYPGFQILYFFPIFRGSAGQNSALLLS